MSWKSIDELAALHPGLEDLVNMMRNYYSDLTILDWANRWVEQCGGDFVGGIYNLVCFRDKPQE